jgi:hypothetical protein
VSVLRSQSLDVEGSILVRRSDDHNLLDAC